MFERFGAVAERTLAKLGFTKASRVWADIANVYGTSSYGIPPPDSWTALEQYYGSVVYVYACVNKIARTVASIPWMVVDKNSEKESTGPISELFKQANEIESDYDLKEQITAFMLITGNAFLSFEPAGARVPEWMYMLQSDKVRIVPDSTESIRTNRKIKGYVYDVNGKIIPYLPEEIVHWPLFNPANSYYGLSPLTVGRTIADVERWTTEWNRKFFQNSARPDGYLKIEDDVDQAQAERIRLAWDAQYGTYLRSHRTAVIGKNADYKLVSTSPKDMDFVNLRNLSKRDICNLYEVPLPLIEMTDSTFSNAEAARKHFFGTVIIPMCQRICKRLTDHPLFRDNNLLLVFDFSGVEELRENRQQQSQVAQQLFSIGVPLNDALTLAGIEGYEYEWGKEGFLPMSLVHASEAGMGQTINPFAPPGDEDEDEEEKPKKPKPKEDEEDEDLDEEKSIMKQVKQGGYDELSWYIHIKSLATVERRFASAMKKLFEEQMREILSKLPQAMPKAIELKGTIDPAILLSVEEWEKRFASRLRPYFSDSMQMGIDEAVRQVKDRFGVEFLYSVDATMAAEWLARKVMIFSADINKVTAEKIREAIVDGLTEAGSIAEIAERVQASVKDTFRSMTRYRGELIARTETIGAANAGSLQAYKESGVVKRKRWFAALDERTRESHKRAHKLGPVPIRDPFVFQGEEGGNVHMMNPGDPSGGPSEVCNCRCTLLPLA